MKKQAMTKGKKQVKGRRMRREERKENKLIKRRTRE